MTMGMVIVLAITVVAVVLFVWEPIPLDQTALAVLAALVILEPWTGVDLATGLSGFSNPATIAVLALLVLSEGVRKTGVVQVLGEWMAEQAGESETRQLATIIVITAILAGFVNNTPIVALLIPVVINMANKGKTSPSKLLIPLSYASMLGGMLTLIGTSTNLLASDIARRVIGQGFSMFEFTSLGLCVLIAGFAYMMTIGRRLLPERVQPEETSFRSFEMKNFLGEVCIEEDSEFIGVRVGDLPDFDVDFDILQVIRDGKIVSRDVQDVRLRPKDIWIVCATRTSFDRLLDEPGLTVGTRAYQQGAEFKFEEEVTRLVEIVIPKASGLVGQQLEAIRFEKRFGAKVLALRRGGEDILERVDEIPLEAGDTLLLQASERGIERLQRSDDVMAVRSPQTSDFRTEKVPLAIGIVAAVVGLAAFEVLPIALTALMGIVAMVVFGVVQPGEAYKAVDWQVIILLAGLIPLGMAMERSGLALYLGQLVAETGDYLSPLMVLWIFYVFTAILTAVMSNNASVVLLIPVAARTAEVVGANPYAFVLGVTFAANTAFLGPIGYQTNLFVYGPGGYKFWDFLRVGALLQLILSVVTVGGIAILWGV